MYIYTHMHEIMRIDWSWSWTGTAAATHKSTILISWGWSILSSYFIVEIIDSTIWYGWATKDLMIVWWICSSRVHSVEFIPANIMLIKPILSYCKSYCDRIPTACFRVTAVHSAGGFTVTQGTETKIDEYTLCIDRLSVILFLVMSPSGY